MEPGDSLDGGMPGGEDAPAGEPYEDGDYFDEGLEEEEGMLDADHPMLARIQAALTKQLENNLARARVDIGNKAEELKQARKEREDLGVELYQVQQGLAKLQMHLEKTHENHNLISQMREQAEADLQRIRQEHGGSLRDVKTYRSKYDKYQVELDKLNLTLVEVSKYTEDMQGEIAITRRATYKAEEDITKMETGKKQQDLLIDRLNEQLKGLHEKYQLYEAQLLAQKEETRAAGTTLGDANREMEQIQFEKKQLLNQWRSALIGMQRRDEALQATMEAIRKQQEQDAALDGEMLGIRKALAGSQERHENLTNRHRRVLADRQEGERVIDQNTEKHKKLNDKFAMCKKALDQTDRELTKAQQDHQAAVDDVSFVEAKIQKVAAEVRRLEEDKLNSVSEQTSLDKSAQNLKAAIERKNAAIADKQIAAATLENDLSRIRVDTLNTAASNVVLKQRLEQMTGELKGKDSLIQKYEQEIRRRNDEIEKKEHQVSVLNRKLDAMKEKAGIDAARAQQEEEEAMGPLEATIRELQAELATKGKESDEMQRRWIHGQTELVAVENDNAAKAETTLELKSRITILSQKRIRIDQQFETVQRELADLQRGMDSMHIDMTKMNALIAKHRRLRETLADDNHQLEQAFVHRLADMEADAARMEAAVVDLKAEKERLLTEVAESEREMMLWEKKISLERETQAALDPEVGATEVKAMQKEIHRMKLRFAQLKKREEHMLGEMERAIYKRDNIESKGKTATLRKSGETQASLRKSVAELSKKLKLTTHDANATLVNVQRLREHQTAVASELEQLHARKRELAAQEDSVYAAIQTQEIERAFHETETQKNQQIVQTLQSALTGAGDVGTEHELREQLRAAEDEMSRAADVAQTLVGAFPSLEHQLRAVLLPASVQSSLAAP